jgi:hypothetical protein
VAVVVAVNTEDAVAVDAEVAAVDGAHLAASIVLVYELVVSSARCTVLRPRLPQWLGSR